MCTGQEDWEGYGLRRAFMLNDKLHVSYQSVEGASIGIQYPNDSAQSDKCGLHGCAKYAFKGALNLLQITFLYNCLCPK